MLDVVFILLIFFIVTSTFLRVESVDMRPPPPSDEPPKTSGPPAILIQIDQENRIFVDQKPGQVLRARVGARVERELAETPSRPVVIEPHDQTDLEVLIDVFSQARLVAGEKVIVQRKVVG